MVIEEPAPAVDIPVDFCDAERQRIDGIIAEIQADNGKIAQMKARKESVITHLNKMQEAANGMVGNENLAKHLGYFFMSIWMCALAAIAMGFVLSIYSHLNSVVYDSVDHSDWLITTQIRDAHTANKNQPLLGLLLTFVTSLMLFGYVSKMDLTAPKAIWEKAKSTSIEMFNELPGMTASAPAPSEQANDVAEEIKADEQQVEESVSVEPAPIDSMSLYAPSQEYPDMYPDYSGEFDN
jgi:hypothetical protein